MGNSFDVRLERLTGTGVRRLPLRSASQELPGQGGITPSLQEEIRKRGTFYLETFGCQMNEHDSEKVAGVLLARGDRQGEEMDAADVVLYHTWSVPGELRPEDWRGNHRRSAERPTNGNGGANEGVERSESCVRQGFGGQGENGP